jgi:GNAT superfamily N-acetyltransferase
MSSFVTMMALGNYHIAAAQEDDDIIGIMGLWFATKFYCGNDIEIDGLIIAEHARDKGLGSTFMSFVKILAKERGCDSVMLDVYQWNERANRFYDRHGFDSPGFHRVLWLNESLRACPPDTAR